MLPTIKSEFRKLLTIRSTYVITFIVLAFVFLMCFYFEGYKGNTGSVASHLAPTALQEIVRNAAGIGALFVGIIAALFMAHEYRYNMIMYTLTANARRTKVLLAKIFTITVFGVVFGLITVLFGVGVYMLGVQLRDATLPIQDINWLETLGKVAFYYAGYALIGLLLATLLRAVVGTIVVLLLFPSTIETLLRIVLKDNAVYLPFASLDTVIGNSMIKGDLTSNGAIGVVAIYLVVGWVITWYLFLRRDAN